MTGESESLNIKKLKCFLMKVLSGWSLVVAGVAVVVGVILVCVAIVVVGAVFISIIFVLDKVAWGTIVGGFVIVLGVCGVLMKVFHYKF